jgi:two-component system sensor histidine kinase HydH
MKTDRTANPEPIQEDLSVTEVVRDFLTTAVLAVDAERRINLFNPAAEALTLLKAEEVLNRPLEVLPLSLAEIINETLLTGRAIIDRQITFPANNPRGCDVRVSTSVARTSAGTISGVVALMHDVSSVQRFEEGMRQFDRLASIGTLAASMAHEIKNALQAVKTFVELLLQKDPAAELAQTVGRELRRIDSIVSQMLKFAGPARPTFGPIRVQEVLDHSLRLIQHQLDEQKISLHRSFRAASDLVRGDDYQLEQAFLNLFFNAVEATGPNGKLSVATDIIDAPAGTNTRQLRVTIKDTGTGIPPENMGRMFEPFFTTKSNGTGLGLPITRRIIQEHNGSIAVESKLDRGTTFRVVLPLAEKLH